jgi:hypothetical protein
MALGNAQFFDNNGNLLTAGVLYSFQAGTTTQQATYTDSTGAFVNPNPIPFGAGARVSIWLSPTNNYKFVLCLKNDGAACAPADVLFSVDQVPACPGCTAGGNTFTGTFISGTPSPATTGVLELATTDAICWRNQAGTTNLCITKDASDVLEWTGGTIKFPEIGCSAVFLNFDYLCANSATHHLSVANNAGLYGSIPLVQTAGLPAHLAGFATNGIDLVDSGALPPASSAVTFSSTPTFTATSNDQLFTMTLTGNVTGSTLVMTGMPVPSIVTFVLTQDATGSRTFVWPTNVLNAPSVLPAIGAVTTVPCIWDGTNCHAPNVLPTPSFYPPQRVTPASGGQPTYPLSLTAATQTIVLTESVTFPSDPGTYRADIRYGIWLTTTSNNCSSMVVDTTNTRAWAFNMGYANGASGWVGNAASELSSQTYAAGAVATFTLQVLCPQTGGIAQSTNPATPGTLSPNITSFLDITPVSSK